MPLPVVSAALVAGALGVLLAVHAGATPSVSTAGGPALGITVRGAHESAGCSVRAAAPVADCSAVNLFAGARLSPGSSHTTVVVARNAGRSAIRGLDLVPGLCTSPGTPPRTESLCSAIRLRVTAVRADGYTVTPVRDVPLAALRRTPLHLAPLPVPGERESVRLTITLDRQAPLTLLGGSIALPLSWHAGD